MNETFTRFSKAGRPPRFKKPEELWEVALRYFEECDNNPIAVGKKTSSSSKNSEKNGAERKVGKMDEVCPRPYTLYGLCAFACIPKWHTFKDNYKNKKGFPEMCERIENIISSQQVEGAMVGLYNSNLTARLNNIAEHNDVTTNGKDIKSEMSDDELQAKLEEIRRKTEHITPIGFK